MTYFKMMPREFAEGLVTRGSVKITTLFRCKEQENAGPGRSDLGEGDIFHDMLIPSFRTLSPEVLADPQALQELWEQGYEPATNRFSPHMKDQWVQVQTRRVWRPARNVYVYCVAREQTRACELKFWTGREDVWVEIFDGERFFAALDEHMKGLGHEPHGLHDIRYRPRLFGQNLDAGHPATVKPRFFKDEHETRGIWKPGAWPVDWIFPVVPALVGTCRIERAVEPRKPFELSLDMERAGRARDLVAYDY
jgi:hypothetical protein